LSSRSVAAIASLIGCGTSAAGVYGLISTAAAEPEPEPEPAPDPDPAIDEPDPEPAIAEPEPLAPIVSPEPEPVIDEPVAAAEPLSAGGAFLFEHAAAHAIANTTGSSFMARPYLSCPIVATVGRRSPLRRLRHDDVIERPRAIGRDAPKIIV